MSAGTQQDPLSLLDGLENDLCDDSRLARPRGSFQDCEVRSCQGSPDELSLQFHTAESILKELVLVDFNILNPACWPFRMTRTLEETDERPVSFEWAVLQPANRRELSIDDICIGPEYQHPVLKWNPSEVDAPIPEVLVLHLRIGRTFVLGGFLQSLFIDELGVDDSNFGCVIIEELPKR